MQLESILQFLDATLGIPDFPDYPGAANGLQVQGTERVHRIGAAVDAGVETIEAAATAEVDLLLVHHGLFWEGLRPVTGRRYRRLAPLMQNGISLYGAHLPLDAHEELGNAAQLLRALGLEPETRFGQYEGVGIGFTAHLSEEREAFRDRVSQVVEGPVHLIPGGPVRLRRIGVVTGAGGSMIREAAEAGLDGLLTGEGAHHTFLDAMELGVNVFYAGHYATETWGVRALAARLESEFGLPWEFLDFPTGL
ncbi:MAG: Nif3-like dinuclear metal center hexameric protein [Gemmatimonadota bacterium]